MRRRRWRREIKLIPGSHGTPGKPGVTVWTLVRTPSWLRCGIDSTRLCHDMASFAGYRRPITT